MINVDPIFIGGFLIVTLEFGWGSQEVCTCLVTGKSPEMRPSAQKGTPSIEGCGIAGAWLSDLGLPPKKWQTAKSNSFQRPNRCQCVVVCKDARMDAQIWPIHIGLNTARNEAIFGGCWQTSSAGTYTLYSRLLDWMDLCVDYI